MPPKPHRVVDEPITFVKFTGHEHLDEIGGNGKDFVCTTWILAKVTNMSDGMQENYINRLKATNKNIMLVRDPNILYIYSRFSKEKQSTLASVFANALDLNEKVQKNLGISKPYRLGPKAKELLADYVLFLRNNAMSNRVISLGKRQIEGFDTVEHFLSEASREKNCNETERLHTLACHYDIHQVMSDGLIKWSTISNSWTTETNVKS